MELDLTNLNTLLALPCIIDEKKPFFLCPLLTKANKFEKAVYRLKVLPGEDVTALLRRVYGHDGPYHMDCLLYAHLASRVLNGTWPTKGGSLHLFLDGEEFGH